MLRRTPLLALLLPGPGRETFADTNLFGPSERIRIETEENLDDKAALLRFLKTL